MEPFRCLTVLIASSLWRRSQTDKIDGVIAPVPTGEDTMLSKIEIYTLCVALSLAVSMAMMSAPAQTKQTYQIFQSLRLTYGAAADRMAGAIAENPQYVVPP
jgi:hypothetical protein